MVRRGIDQLRQPFVRSNDEVNLALFDPALAGNMAAGFERDLAASRPVSYAEWTCRPWHERALALAGWFLQRQE